MKNVPAMSKKQEPHFLRSKSSARKNGHLDGPPSSTETLKKSPARLDLAGKNAFNCWQDKVFRLSGGGEPSGPPAPADSGMP